MGKIIDYFHSIFFRDRLILVSAGLAILLNIILWIILGSKFGYSQEKVTLHFSVIYGIDFVGRSSLVYQIAIFGLLVAVVNFVLAKMIYEKERLFAYFLSVAAGFAQVILLIAVLSLVNLNFP